MKRSLLNFAVLLLLCSCNINIIDETESKFKEAPQKYPELTFVTADELRERLTCDGYEYKVIIYNLAFSNSPNWWTKVIEKELIPKWKAMDTTKVGLYVISIDCACLEGTDSFFTSNQIELPRYVIRDSTEGFCSYVIVK